MSTTADLDAMLAVRATPLRLWWRDDDAGRDHPRLARLLDLAQSHDVPVSLAIVPDWLEPVVAQRIAGARRVTVLQHGVEHRDHARPGERKIELGGSATPASLGSSIVAGRRRLEARFREAFLPVMVPPWNRTDREFAGGLAGWGLTGFSGWRGVGPPPSGACARVDTHIDAIDWRQRRCRTVAELLADLSGLLHLGAVGPIGLLTHHRDTDDAGFAALDHFLDLVHYRPRLQIESAALLFREAH